MPRSESMGVRADEFWSPVAVRAGCSKGERPPLGVARTPTTFDGSGGALGGAGAAAGCCCAATTATPDSAAVPKSGPIPAISERRERPDLIRTPPFPHVSLRRPRDGRQTALA